MPKKGYKQTEDHRRKMIEVHKRENLSEETRKKLSDAMKGRIVSEETRRKIRDSNKGKTHSEEARRKISEANKGKIFSEEHRKKISNTNKRENLSEETIKKMSESHKGKVFSEETKRRMSESRKGKISSKKGIKLSEEHKRKISESKKGNKHHFFGKTRSEETKRKIQLSNKYSIEYILKKYSFFSKIEEMRYDPDKPIEEKEIQVHCKYFDCENSKEKGGWFTPTASQLHERIRNLEKGGDLSYFYCCQECKDLCPLYNSLGSDPFRVIKELPYTYEEYQTFRQHVLTRDNRLCQFCGSEAVHVHHERPQKLEPFFSLDPDFAWSCCKECHYEKGHKAGTECDTSNLAKQQCTKTITPDMVIEQMKGLIK